MSVGLSPKPLSQSSLPKVIQIGLQYIGTPYMWGGADIRKGIDASHFIEVLYKLAGKPALKAPILNQEKTGKVVYAASKTISRGGVRQSVSAPNSLTALRPGDRLIFQYDDRATRSGNQHTGLYIGPYKDPTSAYTLAKAFIHASSSKGVSVSDLDGTYVARILRYALRD